MTVTCSPSEIISDIIDILKESIKECYSKPVSTWEVIEKYKGLLERLSVFEKDFVEHCYVGGRTAEAVLSWLRVAKITLNHCVKTGWSVNAEATVYNQISLLSNLLDLYGMKTDQILKELSMKTDLSRRIKELYLTGIEDKVEGVEDESFRFVIRSIWTTIEPDLRRAVETYAVSEKLVELAIRIELLREKGINLDNMLVAVVKNEIKYLISEIQSTENKRAVGVEDTGRILGSLRKLVELVELTNKLGFSKSTLMAEYVEKLKSLASQVEQVTRLPGQPIKGLLSEARKTLEEMRSLLD